MKKHNQKGIATIELVLFAIIIALIGFIGWYVMKQGKDNQKLTDQTVKSSNSATSSKVGSATSEGTKFTFKELGVQVTLPKSLKDIAYTKNTYSSDPSYDVYTAAFKDEASKCGDDATANPAGFANISKHTGVYKAASPSESTHGLLKQFDGVYFSYGDPLYGAVGCPQEVYNKLVDMQKPLLISLQEAFGSAELVQ
jgi:cytoskeletal protein RodZ